MPSVSSALTRSHKKKPAPAGMLELLSTPNRVGQLPFPPHNPLGWSMFKPTDVRERGATEIAQLVPLVPLAQWIEITGGVIELQLQQFLTRAQNESPLRTAWQSLVDEQREILRSIGAPVDEMVCSETAVLETPVGSGLQPVHYDIPRYEDAVHCYTFILSCTEHMSTHVPTLELTKLRGTFTKGERVPDEADLALLADECFTSIPAKPGHLLFFRCDVPHFGPMNEGPGRRTVIFFLWGSTRRPHHCTIQRYPLTQDHHKK
jgi:hypothetical protein